MKLLAGLFLENKTPLAAHAQSLEASGTKILARFQEVGDSPKNHKLLRHIIAIEGWGLSRLRMLLGEKPLVVDSSKLYAPPESSAWNSLLEDFKNTRHELVALVPFLESSTGKVAHNALGDLSARAWLKYLGFHANTESWRLKSQ